MQRCDLGLCGDQVRSPQGKSCQDPTEPGPYGPPQLELEADPHTIRQYGHNNQLSGAVLQPQLLLERTVNPTQTENPTNSHHPVGTTVFGGVQGSITKCIFRSQHPIPYSILPLPPHRPGQAIGCPGPPTTNVLQGGQHLSRRDPLDPTTRRLHAGHILPRTESETQTFRTSGL